MPLIQGKSKKSFSKNVEAEMHAGKPQKQSLAIAYSIKRQAAKKKMAKGGMATADSAKDEREMEMLDKHPLQHAAELRESSEPMETIDTGDMDEDRDMRMMHGAHGDTEADMHDEMHEPSADKDDDMIDRIMMKRKHMAKGGMVDGDEPDQHDMKKDMSDDDGMVDPAANNAEQKNHLDDMNYDALHSPFTDSDMMDMSQPMDSNEHGHEIDSDSHDMVDLIRRKMMSRRRS